jgi:predicted nuclease of restriction endonuclease-like (RecB) superfamily
VSALSTQLSWTHFTELIVLDDPLKREFYAELSRLERWSVRRLRANIDRLMYERNAVSKQPEEVVRRELIALRDVGCVKLAPTILA